jgi:hypothetical protein
MSKLGRKIKEIGVSLRYHGPVAALVLVVFPALGAFCIRLDDRFQKIKSTFILKYLERHYSYVVDIFRDKKNIEGQDDGVFPIWVCWWQGEAEMPNIVNVCYRSLLKNANGHSVTLIRKNNYQKYVTIPDYIKNKFDKGDISIAHWSDVIRVCLLFEHGGMWIDATYFVTDKISHSYGGGGGGIRYKFRFVLAVDTRMPLDGKSSLYGEKKFVC